MGNRNIGAGFGGISKEQFL